MKGLVLALPRSRTSWLSFALGATHEYLSNGGNEKLLPEEVLCVEINPKLVYPKCPTIVIERDVVEVIESLSFFDNPIAPVELSKAAYSYSEALKQQAETRGAVVVPYRDINTSREVFEEVFGIVIDKPRWDFMCDYRIEPVSEDLNTIVKHKSYL